MSHEICAHEMHAYEVHAREVHAYEMHAREMYAHEMHTRKVHVREMHAHKAHVHEIHVREICALSRECDDYQRGLRRLSIVGATIIRRGVATYNRTPLYRSAHELLHRSSPRQEGDDHHHTPTFPWPS
jgi:hypothetical protein